MKRFLAAVVALLGLALAVPSGQTPVLPLMQIADLVPVGGFDVPGAGWDYGGTAPAYNPVNNSLFLIGWNNTYASAEINIPAVLGGTTTLRQGLRDPFEGKKNDIGVSDNRVGGQFVHGGKLFLSVYAYYDASYTQTRSHFSRPTDLSVTGQVTGPVQVSTTHNAGYVSGYMADVPAAWQAAIGADMVTGNCCIPILSRTSYGPALFAFDAATMKATADLLWYDGAHPLEPYGASGSHPMFNGSTSVTGVVIPEGTSTVVFFGRTGIGPYCYGDGAECGDPDHAAKGEHAYPYVPYLWLYDINDLIRVKNGQTAAWSVRPYAHGQSPVKFSGVAYDRANGLLYLPRIGAASNGVNPRINVFRIQGGAIPPPPPPPAPVDCVGAFSQATSTTSACVGGTQTVTTTRTYSITTAANGGTACLHPHGYVETTTTQQACTMPPPASSATLSVTGGVYECRWVLTSTPPTTDTGWGVTFTIDALGVGTRDTSAPFTRTTSTVKAGMHQIAATWTRTGSASVTLAESRACS